MVRSHILEINRESIGPDFSETSVFRHNNRVCLSLLRNITSILVNFACEILELYQGSRVIFAGKLFYIETNSNSYNSYNSFLVSTLIFFTMVIDINRMLRYMILTRL